MELTPEQIRNKALFQFDGQVMRIMKPFEVYGMKVYAEGATTAIHDLAVALLDRVDGKDVPIYTNWQHAEQEETYRPDD